MIFYTKTRYLTLFTNNIWMLCRLSGIHDYKFSIYFNFNYCLFYFLFIFYLCFIWRDSKTFSWCL